MYAVRRHALRCWPRRCTRRVRNISSSPRLMDAGPAIDIDPSAGDPGDSRRSRASFASSVAGQAMLGSLGTVVVLALGGLVYHHSYKEYVVRKIGKAFEPGSDPIMVLNAASTRSKHLRAARSDEELDDGIDGEGMVVRPEQALIDGIVQGDISGRYWLVNGPKGCGKFSMIISAMLKNEADGVAVVEAHVDPELFRLRLGKALNYEFSEDYVGRLFSRPDPREAGPLLDIERAFNKLEKVALRYQRRTGRPIVMIINNLHLLKDSEESRSLLHLLQQRAETYAQARIMTTIFISDDHWPFLALRKLASRMTVLNVSDLDKPSALRAIRLERARVRGERPSDRQAEDLWRLVGGRLSHIAECVRSEDMVLAARRLLEREKAWLLSRTGLIEDCDDDVMDEQKWSSSSWLLMKALAEQAEEVEREAGAPVGQLPGIPTADARQIMTRADFLPQLDHDNIVNIDATDSAVRADSPLLLNAMRSVVSRPGFPSKLENVLDRVSAIESLGRTRELVWKEGTHGPGVLDVKLQK